MENKPHIALLVGMGLMNNNNKIQERALQAQGKALAVSDGKINMWG